MANTVSVLNFTNTFGDLLTQQNISAKELNNLGANNYTKDSGTLYLNGIGTGLSVTNTAAIGAGVVSTTLSVGGDSTLLGNVFLNALGYSLQVANNAIVHKQLLADSVTANTVVTTTALNTTGTATVNNLTSNNVVLSTTLNATNSGYFNNLKSNNTVSAPYINATTRGYFEDITSNNQITTTYLNLLSNVISDLNVTTDIRGRDYSGRVGTFNNLITSSLTVSGNFVVSSPTIYSSNTFVLNAGTGAGQTSTLGVDRGVSGANAAFRWNESLKYWQTLDVQNGQYYKVLTEVFLSDSTLLNSSTNVATSAAVNNLQNQITANTNTFTGNVNTLTTNLAAVNNYSQTSFARANTSSNTFTGTTGTAIPNNGRMTFSSNNGVVISATANTLYVNTPQDLTTLSNPSFNSIYQLGNPLSVDNGGIGASDKVQGLINLLPSTIGVANGSVLAANANTIYWTTRGPFFANNLTFTAPFNGIGATQNTIQLAIQDLETRKATIASPTFTGTPLAPTAANGTNSTQIATTAFVNTAIVLALGGATSSGPANISISGNANTVNNGVYTTGSYSNPTWITTLASTKITGTIPGTQISGAISGTAGGVTGYTINQSVGTTDPVRFLSLGVGTAASATTGEIRATNNITAYYSDERLKTRLGPIENALEKVSALSGFYHEANELAKSLGYEAVREVGVSAQEVEKVMPEVVAPAPIDEQYMTVRYERLVPLLIEAIKELKAEVDSLKSKQE